MNKEDDENDVDIVSHTINQILEPKSGLDVVSVVDDGSLRSSPPNRSEQEDDLSPIYISQERFVATR